MEIARAYDSLPYPSKFFTYTSPSRMGALAVLHSLEPAPADNCRVLELGCGNASNLIAQAYTVNTSEFVGIDISPGHIRHANETLEGLGLSNIDVRELDLMDLSSGELGEFDYIVAHGLIAWIPIPVRDRVFEIFSELLAPNGIGYLSYNAYPGSHYRKMVREIMRYHTDGVEEPVKKVNEAMRFLDLLAGNSLQNNIIRPIFKHEAERHRGHELSDIFHDDLSDEYHPLYFYQFCELLKERELQFICEAELHAMSPLAFSGEVQELTDKMEDIVEKEQYLDFFRGRIFRQSLFCRAGLEVDRSFEPSTLLKLMVAAPIRSISEDPDLTGPGVEKFVGTSPSGIEIDHPLTKVAMLLIGKSWGRAVPVAKLLDDAQEWLESNGVRSSDWESERQKSLAILMKICRATSLIEMHTHCPDADQGVPERPNVNRLARRQFESSEMFTSMFGLTIGIEDPVALQVLRIADGTRDKSVLLEELRAFVTESEGFEDKEEFLENLSSWLEGNLEELGRLGVFEP